MPETPTVAAPERPPFPSHLPNEAIEVPETYFERPDLPYRGPENARTVLGKRYLKKNEDGDPIEDPETMFWRVATHIAKEDFRYGATEEEVYERAQTFYELMVTGRFEPNSPTLMNAGRALGQLSACFVLPVEDSLKGIYKTLQNMALIHQSGGGTGFSWSRLRPRGDVVKSTMGVASGPVSFMKVYDASTEAVKQGGTRRGANMGILRVDHPDIEEFIRCKEDTDKVTNFNISVALTDAFMEAVSAGEDYDLVNPRTGEVAGRRDAREVFDTIVHHAWRTGEPGVFFIDEANRTNPVPHVGVYESTNPCGEQCLLPYDVCNLGSINVGAFLDEDVESDDWRGRIDWEALGEVARISTRFLDNVIDANQFPLEEIDDLALRIRRIGNGVMGFADLLVRLGIPYDSEEGVEVGRELQRFLTEQERQASHQLALERGAFPAWETSIWGPDATCARDENGDRIRPETLVRNCNINTVAPTGTISIIAGCSGGIEPHFAIAFMRNQAGELMPDVNEDFVRVAKEEGWYNEDLMERIAAEGHIHMDEVPGPVQEVFRTSHDIAPRWHVRMQAAFQENVDNAISKCIAEGTLIPTNRGLVAVEDFAAPHAPDTFAETDREYTTGGHRILSHYRAGRKPATRIRLDNGSDLVGATESHRVMTPDGWRLMSDLEKGDLVVGRLQASHGPGGMELGWDDAFRASARHLPTPDHMTPDLARWLGMIAADGYTLEDDGRVELTCRNETVEAVFRETCLELFGLEPNETPDDRTDGVKRLYLTSRNLVRFVESLIGRGSYEKHAPVAVLRGNFQEKLAFLEGVTLDGFVTDQGLTLYDGMSEQLAYHVAEISRSFGLPRIVQTRKWVTASEAYAHGVVVSNEMQEIVTPIEPHKRREAYYKRYRVLADVMSADRSRSSSRSREYSALRSAQNGGRSHVFDTTATALGLPDDTPVHRVTAVEPAGMVDLYDVEVDEAHEYVVNGMVSHNTTNFAQEATEEDVREIYELAHDLGCKGVTVYRDGSREGQVLSTGKNTVREEEAGRDYLEERLAAAERELKNTRAALEDALDAKQELRAQLSEHRRRVKRDRPETLSGKTKEVDSPLGTMYVTINEDDEGEPFEVFVHLGKAGGSAMADAEGIGRLISLSLRSGVPIKEVHKQLRGISSDRAVGFGEHKIHSTPDAIAIAIERYLDEKEGIQQELLMGEGVGASPATPPSSAPSSPNGRRADEALLEFCPSCGSNAVAYEEGCLKCHACGESQCG